VRRLAMVGAGAIALAIVSVGFINSRQSPSQPVRIDGLNHATTATEAIPPIPAPVRVSQNCPLLLAGGRISVTGDPACGTLTFGGPVASLDCATAGSLPSTLLLESYDGSVAADPGFGRGPGPSVTYTGSSCQLRVPGKQEASLVTRNAVPNNVLVIADYVQPENILGTIGVDARCEPHGPCVNAVVEGIR